ncbi:MAG: FeoA family protein [Christensenellales bacterium]
MTLDQLKAGEKGIILSVGSQSAVRSRLLDMGLTPHTRVEVLKTAPLGDPIEIFLRGYALTLRKQDAKTITVSRVDS